MAKRAVVISILLIVPLLLTGCGLKSSKKKKPTAKPTPTASQTASLETAAPAGDNYLEADPASLDAAIRANYQQAETKAKLWKTDAVLYHVAARLPANLKTGQATEVYTFGSPTDAYNWWTLTVSGKTGKSVRAIIPKEDYLGTTLQPVPLKFWKSNYAEALQLAESAGGADYRAGNPGAEITVNLSVGEPKNFLWWSVEYSLAEQPYKILVNPATKEVFNEAAANQNSRTEEETITEE